MAADFGVRDWQVLRSQSDPPPVPLAGKWSLFVDADGVIKLREDDGTVHAFSLDTHTHPSSSVVAYRYATNHALADPGAGLVRFDNASAASVTAVALDDLTDGGTDVSGAIGSLVAGDGFYFQVLDDAGVWGRYTLSGPPIDHDGWFEVPLAYVASAGSEPANNTPLLLEVTRATGGGGGGGMTNPMTEAADLIVGGASGTPTRLGKGSGGQVLTVVGADLAWQTPPTYLDQATADTRYVELTGDVMTGDLRVNRVLSLGAAPAAWNADFRVLDLGGGISGVMGGNAGNTGLWMLGNYYWDTGGVYRNATANPYSGLVFSGGNAYVYGGPSPGAAGTSFSPVERLRITPTGATASVPVYIVGALGTTGFGFEVRNTTASSLSGWRLLDTAGTARLQLIAFSSGYAANNDFGAAGAQTTELHSVGWPLYLGTTGAVPLHLGTNGAVQATLDATGNLGVAGAPPAFGSAMRGYTAAGGRIAVWGNTAAGSGAIFSNNLYYDGAAYRYVENGVADQFVLSAGTLAYNSSASGSAGGAVTLLPRIHVNAKGQVGIGAIPHTGWHSTARAIDWDAGVAAAWSLGTTALYVVQNTYWDGTNWRNTASGDTTIYSLGSGFARWYLNANPGAAGTSYTPAERARIDQQGIYLITGSNLRIAAGSGAPASYGIDADSSVDGGYQIRCRNASTGANAAAIFQLTSAQHGFAIYACSNAYGAPYAGKSVIQSNSAFGLMLQNNGGGPIECYIASSLTTRVNTAGHLTPGISTGTYSLGQSGNAWLDVYATRGAFNGSHSSLKDGFAPLEPERALEVVRSARVGTFRYKPVNRPTEPSRKPDAFDDRERVGIEADHAHAWLSPDSYHVNAQDTACLALAAIAALAEQNDRLRERLAALEAQVAA